MKFVIFILIFCVCYTKSLYMSKQPKSPCESETKNTLIEHFFNIIFTEFQVTPPVCVCVQMCAGQSTYCYPNGCLKRDDLQGVDSPQAAPQPKGDRSQYMFVVDEQKNDFMQDFLERTYPDESAPVTPPRETIRDIRSDFFKDKYSMLVKYKKMPSVEFRYNLREQVKNMKSDVLKLDNVDLSKTRWPMNKRNLVSGHKTSKIEKRAPLIGKTNVFMAMLPANDFVEYPPKYFKRDVAKTLHDDDTNKKSFYLLENTDNATGNNNVESISLETLMENLINNSFKTKQNVINNTTQSNVIAENKVVKTKVATEKTTLNTTETINVISMNFTSEKVDKNKYTDDSRSISNPTNNFNEMISSLSKRIEIQNNNSMEIAQRVVGDFDEEDTTWISNTESLKDILNSPFTEIVDEVENETANQETTTPTSADFNETMVTKKNRQRRARKLQNSKNNAQ